MENTEKTEKPKGMYFKDVLIRLGISRTTFYRLYHDKVSVTKDPSGYRNIYLIEDIEKLEELIKPIEIIKS